MSVKLKIAQPAGAQTEEVPLVQMRKPDYEKQRKQLFGAGMAVAFALVGFVQHYSPDEKANAATTPATALAGVQQPTTSTTAAAGQGK